MNTTSICQELRSRDLYTAYLLENGADYIISENQPMFQISIEQFEKLHKEMKESINNQKRFNEYIFESTLFWSSFTKQDPEKVKSKLTSIIGGPDGSWSKGYEKFVEEYINPKLSIGETFEERAISSKIANKYIENCLTALHEIFDHPETDDKDIKKIQNELQDRNYNLDEFIKRGFFKCCLGDDGLIIGEDKIKNTNQLKLRQSMLGSNILSLRHAVKIYKALKSKSAEPYAIYGYMMQQIKIILEDIKNQDVNKVDIAKALLNYFIKNY